MPETKGRTRLNNKQVAEILRSIADLLLLQGENRFVVLAYQNAARTVEDLHQDINQVAAEGRLEELPKIGKAIAEKIQTLLETGRLPYYEELSAQVPPGVVEMLQIPDVGPKTVERLWKELNITSIDQLKAAAQAGKLRTLKGFGAKTEERILKSIELMSRRTDDRTPIGQARPLAEALVAGLQAALPPENLPRIEIAGSLRRWRETIGDLDLLAVSESPAQVMEAYRNLPQAVGVLGSGPTKTSISLPNGMQADLRVVEAKHWGAALCYFTGSKAHNIALREHALRLGWSLNEYCLTARNHEEFADGVQRFFEEEEALYAFLGMQWISPELREDNGEIQAALAHQLPVLITAGELQGELHGHTTWSDGRASVAEMAEAARLRGRRFWAVTDHSVGLGVTQGVDSEALQAQRQEIDEVNARYQAEGVDFRLLQGVEVEVLADGSLGLPDEALAGLDVVVASIHTGLRQDRETITARCLRAIQNPHVDILGHPTGRLLGRRPASEIDMEQVLQACAEAQVAVEINANPARLDVNGALARRAVELGCKLVINTDAHGVDELALAPYGVHTARRGWVRAQDVVNTWPLDEILNLFTQEH